MLLDGRAFDVKKKKFWFETGWNAERFMVPLRESEGEDEDEGDGEEKGVCCSIFEGKRKLSAPWFLGVLLFLFFFLQQF